MSNASASVSIGDLATATGLSVDTIRVWERRYGRPVPHRLPSGHRRYTEDDIRWLRRVAEALALGMRPSRIVPLNDSELVEFLETHGTGQVSDDENITQHLALVRAFDRDSLWRSLTDLRARAPARDLIVEGIVPLVERVGRAWADGEVEVRHEHFLTEVLEDFLRGLREDIVKREAPRVLMATLSGEMHGLGLQMAAVFAALTGFYPVILGTDVPNEEIVRSAKEAGANIVAISVSLATGGVETDRTIADLRSQLPEDMGLVVGGRGARGVRRGPRGVDYVSDLGALERFLREAIGT